MKWLGHQKCVSDIVQLQFKVQMESIKIFQTIMTQFSTIVQYELCLEIDCSHPFQVDQVHDASIFCFLLVVGGVGILDLCVKLAHLGKQALINDGSKR